MMYRVLLDDVDILNNDYLETGLINPVVEMELNSAGTFEFTIPYTNLFYNNIKLMLSRITVYEGDEIIFYGRPSEISIDWMKNKKVHCEGCLSYLNDVIIRDMDYTNISLSMFFQNVINYYNDRVPLDMKFTVGNVTVEDRYVNRKLEYISVWEAISQGCLDSDKGYIYAYRKNGINMIDWVKEVTNISDQPIMYAINLKDLTQSIHASEIESVIIPLGDSIDDPSTGKSKRVDISSTNPDGHDYIEIAALVNLYGKIQKVVTFDSVKEPTVLLEQANKYIEKMITNLLCVEVDAVDLHFVDGTYGQFKLGQKVTIASQPHELSMELPIMKISVNLSSAYKSISIGTPNRDSISTYVNPFRD